MTILNTYFYTIAQSRQITPVCIGAFASGKEIIGFANDMANRAGYSLEDIAGLKLIIDEQDEDGDILESHYEYWASDEVHLQAAVDYLKHDGVVYEIYNSDTEKTEFIEAATGYNLEDEARNLAE